MAESGYFQAVIDTCKLLSFQTTNFSYTENGVENSSTNSIYFQLEKIEIELEKYVPRISPLYSALNIDNESKQSQSDYWEGVRDTTNLIRNYLSHNKEIFTPEAYETFLQKILVKSSQKLEPQTSPLIGKLGLEIDNQFEKLQESNQKQEFIKKDSLTEEMGQKIISSEKASTLLENWKEEDYIEEKLQEKETEIYLEADSSSEETNQEKILPVYESTTPTTNWEFETPIEEKLQKKETEVYLEADSFSDETDQEKILPVYESTTPTTTWSLIPTDEEKNADNSEEMVELALEELKRENTISNIRNGLLSQINNEITKLDTETEIKPKEEKKQIPIVQLSPKIEEKDIFNENESFSSSLKDALKMLRTDEDNIED